MTKKLTMQDLPIYREYYKDFLKLIKELEEIVKSDFKHKKITESAYEHAIEIFPNLNAGYNYWSLKGKLQIYNKIRIALSQLQIELFVLKDLNILKNDYSDIIESSIRYIGGLIRKLESPSGDVK